MSFWSADPIVDEAAKPTASDWWKNDPVVSDPSSTFQPAELQQADEQQAMEHKAGATASFGDIGRVASDAMKLPGKLGLFYGNTMAGGPQVAPHWPTDAEVQSPTISPELARAMITSPFGPGVNVADLPKTGVQGAIRGVVEGAGDALSSFSTPESLGLLGIAPEGKLAQRVIAGVFLGQAIQGTPEQWRAFNETQNLADKIRIATSMGLGYGLPLIAGAHTFKGEEPPSPTVRRWPDRQVDAAKSETQPVPESPVPSVDNRTQSETVAPVDIVRQSEVSFLPESQPVTSGVESAIAEIQRRNAPGNILPKEPQIQQPIEEKVEQSRTAETPNTSVSTAVDTNTIRASQPDITSAAGTSNRVFGETYGENVIPGGKGVDTAQLLDDARGSIRSGAVNPYSILSKTRGNGIANPAEYAALAAEHERLVNDAVAKQKSGDPSAQEAADKAENFANAIQPHKTAASDLMRLFQGDLNYDLSTPFGMEQYMKAELGRGMKQSERATFTKKAHEIRREESGMQQAVARADVKVQRHYAKVRDIPMQEAAGRVKEWLKDCMIS